MSKIVYNSSKCIWWVIHSSFKFCNRVHYKIISLNQALVKLRRTQLTFKYFVEEVWFNNSTFHTNQYIFLCGFRTAQNIIIAGTKTGVVKKRSTSTNFLYISLIIKLNYCNVRLKLHLILSLSEPRHLGKIQTLTHWRIKNIVY